jgi:hypothetical protein
MQSGRCASEQCVGDGRPGVGGSPAGAAGAMGGAGLVAGTGPRLCRIPPHAGCGRPAAAAAGGGPGQPQLGRGHVCLDLEAALDDPDRTLSLPPEGAEQERSLARPADLLRGLTVGDWAAALRQPELAGPGVGGTPLVHAGRRLYLRRFWECEQHVAAAVRQRLEGTGELRSGLDAASMRSWLDRLFGPVRGGSRIGSGWPARWPPADASR